MRPLIFIWALTMLLAGFACKNDVALQPYAQTLFLSVADTGVTNVLLKLHVEYSTVSPRIEIRRDGKIVFADIVSRTDTMLVSDSLLPKHNYMYKAYRLYNSSASDSSDAVTVTTMDTTSHSFTFEIDTLGDGSASRLFDVAIINDTIAYAVGAIYKKDSTGNWEPNAHNAVKWNGSNWQLKRIPFIGPCSAVDYPPLRAIWAFSETSLLVTNGGSIVRFDGSNAIMDCGMNSLLTGAINKIWGSNPQDVYAVGNSGTIVHYASGRWQKLESGTTVSINDIFSDTLSSDGERQILAAASNRYAAGDTKLLRITQSGMVNSLSWSPQQPLNTVWFDSRHATYVGGGGLFLGESGRWKQIYDLPNYYSTRIRGTKRNDVFVVGAFGLCGHFNGVSWRHYPEVQLPDGTYEGLAVSSRMIIAVGQVGNRGVVVRGYRQ